MFKRSAIALAVAAVALAFAGCEQNQADVTELATFESREAFSGYLKEPTSHTLFFVWSKDCTGCDKTEDVLKQAAARRTDIKFYKVDAAWTTVRVKHPYIAFVAPGAGITASGNAESLDTARKVTRFLDQRIQGVKSILPLKAAVSEARAKLEAQYKGFEDRMDGVRTKMFAALKDQDSLLADLRSQLEKEGKPFDDEIRAIQARKRAALAGTQAKLDAALDKRNEIRAPFRLEISTIQDEQTLGTVSLQEALNAADEALNNALIQQSESLKRK